MGWGRLFVYRENVICVISRGNLPKNRYSYPFCLYQLYTRRAEPAPFAASLAKMEPNVRYPTVPDWLRNVRMFPVFPPITYKNTIFYTNKRMFTGCSVGIPTTLALFLTFLLCNSLSPMVAHCYPLFATILFDGNDDAPCPTATTHPIISLVRVVEDTGDTNTVRAVYVDVPVTFPTSTVVTNTLF